MTLETVEGFASALVVVVGLVVLSFGGDLDAFDSLGVFGVGVDGYEYAA